MLTTVFGIGVLVLAVFPAIGQFGLLTALSVVYAYLASVFVLPSVLVVWARLVGEGPPDAADDSLDVSDDSPDVSDDSPDASDDSPDTVSDSTDAGGTRGDAE